MPGKNGQGTPRKRAKPCLADRTFRLNSACGFQYQRDRVSLRPREIGVPDLVGAPEREGALPGGAAAQRGRLSTALYRTDFFFLPTGAHPSVGPVDPMFGPSFFLCGPGAHR